MNIRLKLVSPKRILLIKIAEFETKCEKYDIRGNTENYRMLISFRNRSPNKSTNIMRCLTIFAPGAASVD